MVEATISLGLMSFGLLTLVPLLAVGLKAARVAKNDQDSAQIVQTLVEKAKQGTLASGSTPFDEQGNACVASQAAFTAAASIAPVTGNTSVTRLTLVIKPRGAPDHARTYVVVFAPSS